MKRITITYTEDQVRTIIKALEHDMAELWDEDAVKYDSSGFRAKDNAEDRKYNAFTQRTIDKTAKALRQAQD